MESINRTVAHRHADGLCPPAYNAGFIGGLARISWLESASSRLIVNLNCQHIRSKKTSFGVSPITFVHIATMKKIFALLVLAGIANAVTAADIVGNAKAATAKVEMCIGCHGIPGYKATFPEVFQVPMIGGQPAKDEDSKKPKGCP